MLSIAKTIASHLPREVKDRIPERLRMAYQIKLRKSMLAQRSDDDVIDETLESLKTLSLADYVRQDAGSSSEFQKLDTSVAAIEINDSCNLDCAMCKTSEATRIKAVMDLGLFEDIVAKLAARGVRSTNFHTIGDPTANKNLAKYLEIIRRHKLTVSHLSSNCQMLERHLDTLFEYRDVIFEFRPSVDAASKAVYESIRVKGNWEKLLENLVLFAKRNEAASNPFPVLIHNVISKVNYHELAFIPSMFSFVTDPLHHTFSLLKATGPATPYFMENSYFGNDYIPNSPCRIFWGSPVILKDGQVAACCVDYDGSTVFAHIKDGDIGDLFNNDTIRGFRRAHLAGDAKSMPALCQSCYLADPRYGYVISGAIQRFYAKVKKHPVHLQLALNKIGALLKSRDFAGVKAVIDGM